MPLCFLQILPQLSQLGGCKSRKNLQYWSTDKIPLKVNEQLGSQDSLEARKTGFQSAGACGQISRVKVNPCRVHSLVYATTDAEK